MNKAIAPSMRTMYECNASRSRVLGASLGDAMPEDVGRVPAGAVIKQIWEVLDLDGEDICSCELYHQGAIVYAWIARRWLN